MARFGKGKPMIVQARRILKGSLELSSRHEAKQEQGIKGSRATGKIHGLRTHERYAEALKAAGDWAREYAGIKYLDDITPELAQQFLEDRVAQGILQKALDNERNALEYITGRGSLTRVHALTRAERHCRAYTPEQVRIIVSHQTERNALSTLIAYRAGLRAHELLQLRRLDEAQASAHRTWSSDRFHGREGVRYVVIGKGGLRREVLLDHALAERLEARRLDAPRLVVDREIRYETWYDIGGGKNFSQSFSAASKRIFGWSRGAHGMRHSYAQERMAELQGARRLYNEARETVSQEMGHFRADIVNTYLR